MEEVWRDLPGYEGIYSVSNLGKIVSRARLWRSRHKGDMDWAIPIAEGKPYFQACKSNISKTFRVDEAVALAFLGPCPKEHELVHVDGKVRNNRADNLAYLPPQRDRHIRHWRYVQWGVRRGFIEANPNSCDVLPRFPALQQQEL